jgi:dihydropyrimidinase
LRDAANHPPLWEALRRGTLQAISTDHCPFFFTRQKLANATDFTHIPNGGPGIEHRLELLHHFGVIEKKLSLRRWVEITSTAPARLFGLYPKKGTIRVGADADLVLWNPRKRHTISASSHHMNVDYSMYEGMTVDGGADTVVARGQVLVRDGTWYGTAGRGEFLKRSSSSVLN